MIPHYLSVTWAAIVPPLASHLWQSTLFAVGAALLTLTLRRNHAQARYGLWLAASVKFLIPFSLLIAIGGHLAGPRPATGALPGFYSAVQQAVTVTESLAVGHSSLEMGAAKPEQHRRLAAFPVPLASLLAAIWLCGFAIVLSLRRAQWRQISAALQRATPLHEGREVEALRRMERLAGTRKPIAVLLSQSSLEPGVFGILHPVLVWPAGISERLEDAHLEAIVAHELCHIRRRDNFAAALHMAVEALFWFHPVVWWLGARMVEERERACDEAVLHWGKEPGVYAESILKACEFCVASPVACVSGVTGSDLKKRIFRIMTERGGLKLDLRQKLLLGAAALVAIGVPLVFGLANPPQSAGSSQAAEVTGPAPKFEVASIKPGKAAMVGRHTAFIRMEDPPNDGRFYANGPTLRLLLRAAYDVQDSQIVGGPSWMNTEQFDIQAKADDSVNAQLKKLSPAEGLALKHRMIQALLTDRFKLTIKHETKNLPIYALVVAKNGPKIQPSKDDASGPQGVPGGMMFRNQPGALAQVTFQGASMSSVAQILNQQLGRTVIDKTGLKGKYDFTLKFAPDPALMARMMGPKGPGPGPGPGPGASAAPGAGAEAGAVPGMASGAPDVSGPSIFTAIQQQLGLKLVSQKGPVDVLVIEHAEQPSED